MKKCVIISSSPRKNGNSQILCQQFQKGAQSQGHQVELINLSNYQIQPCLACEYCRKHENQCFRKDDADMIIKKLSDADVWVLASPIYFYSISAQLKLLIDRFFAREYEIREMTKRKDVYYILTSGSSDIAQMTGAIETLRGFIKVLRTVDEKGLVNGLGAFHYQDVYKHHSYQQSYIMGSQI